MKVLEKKDVTEIVKILKAGGVIATPTDTVYGFSCMPDNMDAVLKLCKIKKCDEQKMFILLVSQKYDLSKIVRSEHLDFIYKNTPAPLTIIANKNTNLKLAPNFNLPTIAIRIPKDDYLQSILSNVGFIISTSCNIHGESNIDDFMTIMHKFLTINGIVKGKSKNCKPSTIVDITKNKISVIRQGDYKVVK